MFEEIFSPEQLTILTQIILIDLVFAGDNAIIIGMGASKFPLDQRKKIIFWGIGGAVILRIILTLLTAYLLQITGLRLIGGLLLLYIAYKLYTDVIKGSDHDRMVAAKGLKLTRKIVMESETFKKYRPEEYRPGIDINDNEELVKEASNYAQTIFHPVGTCKMGQDENAVVDEKLKVKGLKNLRVIDASIMPNITSGNTNAPTIMIAEKGADMILNN